MPQQRGVAQTKKKRARWGSHLCGLGGETKAKNNNNIEYIPYCTEYKAFFFLFSDEGTE